MCFSLGMKESGAATAASEVSWEMLDKFFVLGSALFSYVFVVPGGLAVVVKKQLEVR